MVMARLMRHFVTADELYANHNAVHFKIATMRAEYAL